MCTIKSEVLALSTSLGEIGIDSLLEDGLFKDIPFIGTGLSVVKLIKSTSDKILLTKIIHFINDLNLHSDAEVVIFKEKYFKIEDYPKIGSKILLVLDQADNVVRIKWLAKCLRLFVDKGIDKNQFLRISSIINSAYSEDVIQIVVFNIRPSITSKNNLIPSYILDHLFSIGLLENNGIDGGDAGGLNSGTIYSLNDFGNIMKDEII